MTDTISDQSSEESEPHDDDRQHLHSLGYAQELKRGMGGFSNFAISFSIISILAGGMTSYWLGMVTGGPRVIMIGWIVVGQLVDVAVVDRHAFQRATT